MDAALVGQVAIDLQVIIGHVNQGQLTGIGGNDGTLRAGIVTEKNVGSVSLRKRADIVIGLVKDSCLLINHAKVKYLAAFRGHQLPVHVNIAGASVVGEINKGKIQELVDVTYDAAIDAAGIIAGQVY